MAEYQRRFSLDKVEIDPKLLNRILSADGDETLGFWDGEKIEDLEAELDRIEERYDVNYNSLPHQKNIPEEFKGAVEKDYPVWACDKKGDCLVGDGVEIRIESADTVREFYTKNHGGIEAFVEKLRIERQKFMDSLEGPS
ncbi:MAG: hypothetical protein G3M78_03595 [Candidatus Nitrohelix vancouverensis]|uniref:Uncharacterized protein n=1 Tax=Candidatus Nitrohelix vancouverensis TaxID=2705534 RepID=A0A7T0C0Y1_9BACT|nr:MAG: hypothetical protein G3M78_03595 [Candidatus Nitrohelix vancouverensis]